MAAAASAGAEYDALVEEFVNAVQQRFPRALLQWEDFKKQNAFNLLERYRQKIPSFNDDIQGTAAVAVAGILAAGRASGTPLEKQRIIILGGGAAGIGIARQLQRAMRVAGLSGEALTRAIAVMDSGGLLIAGRSFKEPAKKEFAWPDELAASYGFAADHPPDLLMVTKTLRPTVLIGVGGCPGVFDETIVRTMAEHVHRPAIFPFSNPTSQSEAIPADLIRWTQGRALIATGSPFAPVSYEGRTYPIGQGNNAYVFPGVGLGALVAEAKVVMDAMFDAAAQRLAESVTMAELKSGLLYPPLSRLRAVSASIAEAVVRAARDAGVGARSPMRRFPPPCARACGSRRIRSTSLSRKSRRSSAVRGIVLAGNRARLGSDRVCPDNRNRVRITHTPFPSTENAGNGRLCPFWVRITPCLWSKSTCLWSKSTCLRSKSTCLRSKSTCLRNKSTCLGSKSICLRSRSTCSWSVRPCRSQAPVGFWLE